MVDLLAIVGDTGNLAKIAYSVNKYAVLLACLLHIKPRFFYACANISIHY